MEGEAHEIIGQARACPPFTGIGSHCGRPQGLPTYPLPPFFILTRWTGKASINSLPKESRLRSAAWIEDRINSRPGFF